MSNGFVCVQCTDLHIYNTHIRYVRMYLACVSIIFDKRHKTE